MDNEIEHTAQYIVAKRSDIIKYIPFTKKNQLRDIFSQVDRGRKMDGKPPLHGIFIESDSPDYEQIKRILLERIARECNDKNNS